MNTTQTTTRKVIVVEYDTDGQLVEGDFIDGVIGEAATIEDARCLAISKGYTLVAFQTPENVPSELIGEPADAFAVGVEAAGLDDAADEVRLRPADSTSAD